jgi:type VI secretion system protein ImpM
LSGFRPSSTGFFGKLPAKGDFVRDGLKEEFVEAWDGWCRRMLGASRAALGAAWERAWMEAPIWRFLIPAGACGGQAVLGVWFASVDKVGRHFPFGVFALASATIDLEDGGAWLDLAETLALACILDDAPHGELGAALGEVLAADGLIDPGWWTEGSPRRRPQRLEVFDLLPEDYAGAMLMDPAPAERL